jgi:pheromone shutdown protein TraB
MNQTQDEPLMSVRADGAELMLLGTAHVSRKQRGEGARTARIRRRRFRRRRGGALPSRYNAMMQPDSLSRMDLFAVIREQRVYMVAASLALSAYQQRLADQFGIEPGAEQRMAIRLAEARGCRCC